VSVAKIASARAERLVGDDERMKSSTMLSQPADVEAALNSSALEPIPKVVELAPGPTSALRDGMARFSGADRHRERRLAVVNELTELNPDAAYEIARRRTEVLFVGQPVDLVSAIAFRIPSEVLCEQLNLAASSSEIIADVLEIVRVIGRGEQLTNACDVAVERLLEVCSFGGTDAVSVISLLYQNFDATASLVINTLVANHLKLERVSAVKQTRRIARANIAIGGTHIKTDDIVILDLDAAGFEFGAGSHHCPGRALAESICRGITDAVASSGYELDFANAIFDDGGVPISVVLIPSKPPRIEVAL
jgi:cytochrome P450